MAHRTQPQQQQADQLQHCEDQRFEGHSAAAADLAAAGAGADVGAAGVSSGEGAATGDDAAAAAAEAAAGGGVSGQQAVVG